MKKKIYFTLLIAVTFTTVNAQVVPPPIPPPPPPGLPINGGVLFLLISGIALGIKKLNDKA